MKASWATYKKKNTMNKDSSSNSSFLVLIILELNNIDQCFYQIVLFVARANQGSLKLKKPVDWTQLTCFKDIWND